MENDEPTVYERTTLYDEVWAKPVKIVAQRYGVSDVALAKTCRKMAIPLPGRGYWAKKKAGTEPPRPPLPACPKGVERTIVIADIWARRAGVPLVAPKEVEAAKASPRIIVPDTLRRPHPLVKQTWDSMKGRGSQDDFIYVGAETCLDVFASRGSRGRALRILDALLKAMEAQDYMLDIIPPKKVTPRWGEERIEPAVTRVKVGEEWYSLRALRRPHMGEGESAP